MTNRCRYCGADVIWATTAHGRPIPVDPTPSSTGNLMLRADAAGRVFATVTAAATGPDDPPRWRTHFVSCPDLPASRRGQHPPPATPVAPPWVDVPLPL